MELRDRDEKERETYFYYLFFFFFFRATPAAYGSSQAQGPIGATAASLHQSLGSKLHLQPTPQLMATPTS